MQQPLQAQFIKSAAQLEQCPPGNYPEFAFIGRSNVGKSSLINMLTGNKKLAKTSSTPGKTQLINHFLIENNWYLVDLPGYGFAKVPLKEKAKWEKMTWDYIENRQNLLYVFVLIDCRIPPQKIDLEFVNKLGEKGIPLKLVFTKWDKVKPMKGQKNIDDFKMALTERWEILPEHFITSSEKGVGRLEMLNLIEEIISLNN
ncbi:ribosome biogenesis GTP-binding protein YihA/YsxC [Marinilongibacter aquaticus]|uniref:ribosome biogenesis GTP-binding protein YihA/YsxC n=1 Tax=Marinilongibacter aquaticus TaxID=2975157 RepID=UPI0021BDC800|nr:ribosome biogenesis GTP-binding protein YihA/YsxC [Marinilongibacter aquaticus]UBM57383.1 ribosome biogenesis GTP-binding protein YihA/YsxC [Marinilongibacter aquaticus]